jgi:hypothetical protein
MSTLAVRFDFAAALVEDQPRRHRVAEILVRPCFRALERVSAHRGDRWIQHGDTSVEAIVAILGDPKNAAVSFDTERGKELVASGEIKNGTFESNQGATRFYGYLVFPVPDELEPTIAATCDLADALDTGAGFIAAEPDYSYAQSLALGGFDPKPRAGLPPRQMIERRGRHRHMWQRHNELAGPEWGTFLGAEHLARLDLEKARASGAFERVVLVSPRLAFLQITKDPTDDLRDDFEVKLAAAREALAPILMDLSDVNLD